jgi:hypothetical protein
MVAMFLPSCSGTVLLQELGMPPASISAVLSAIALSTASGLAAAVEALSGVGDVLRMLMEQLAQLRALLEAGYARAPTLVVVLLAFLVLPAAALVAHLVRSAAHRREQRAATRAAQLRAETSAMTSDAAAATGAPLWQRQAWLSLEGRGGETLPLAGQMIRIGRHRDNDICLPDATVHRYHAVIEHSPEEAFVIIDLSGKDGNGVRVNGERQARVQLADGDVIELGRTRMKFESAPV